MTQNEQNSMQRFLRGEPGGFDALYDLYGDRIYRFCHRLCRNPSDAEDLTQEVFLAAYQGLEKFQGRSSLSTWLYRVALFRWRRIFGLPGPHLVSIDQASERDLMTPDTVPRELNRWALEKAIAGLPDSLREAFLLVKSEGLTCREAAEALDIPQGTLKFRVHQAVVRLQAELRSSDLEGEAATERHDKRSSEIIKESYDARAFRAGEAR